MQYEMKRETLAILIVSVFVVGYVAGRVTMKVNAAAGGEAPVAVAPAATETPTAPATAATMPTPTPATPTPTPTPAPTPAAAPTPVTPPPAVEKIWKVAIHEDDASKGPADAPVTVVVFSAFGCQECAAFKTATDQLFTEYGDRVRVIFKHKVFDAPHPDALVAAQASLAAHAQGKFWEYRDKLFGESGNNLDPSELERQAEAIGLNMRAFRKALDKGTFRTQALRDGLGAYEVGAHSFPNVLANGVRMAKPKGWESLKKLVDAQLAKAEGLVASGTPSGDIYAKVTAGGKIFPQLGSPISGIQTQNASFLGDERGALTMVVFEDFECPYCSKANGNLKAFVNRFDKGVKMVFKHFPLTNIHDNAQLASEAALEAAKQGRFWPYHDKLFVNQKALTRPDLETYAREVGLDMTAFTRALDNGTHQGALQRDLLDGRRVGVTGTPTVFLNGRKYQGPRGYNPDGLEAVARVHLGLDD